MRDEKGRFVKGYSSSPETQFKKGDKINLGRKKPGWSNQTSYKKEARRIADIIIKTFKDGGCVYIFGNGGSLADASHFAAEFNGIGPVIALNDPAKITSIANDDCFEHIFSTQVYDIGKKGDLAIGISSSGKSKNVIFAEIIAKDDCKMEVIDFPRKGKTTQEVQNYQYKLLHEIYGIVKEALV